MTESTVRLRNMPAEVALELDRRYALVRSGHVSVHKNNGEWVKIEHRDVTGRKELGTVYGQVAG